MHRVISGGWLIDTPGMRALRLTDVRDGVDTLFEDVADLADTCRFNDCTHQNEPGCAVQAAISDGQLDPARLERWLKLSREDQRHTETIAQSHKRSRQQEQIYQTGRQRGRGKRNMP